jgi:predicted nuclease of restriction endonuclease-like (RecB) superfamily
MEKKQTAVEWLESQINLGLSERGLISAIKKAKAMEKEQIIDAYEDGHLMGSHNLENTGRQHYRETYGGQDEK